MALSCLARQIAFSGAQISQSKVNNSWDDWFIILSFAVAAFIYFGSFGYGKDQFLDIISVSWEVWHFIDTCFMEPVARLFPCQFFFFITFLFGVSVCFLPSKNFLSNCNSQKIIDTIYLAFNPVGKCYVILHAPVVRHAKEWRVFSSFCEKEGVLAREHGMLARHELAGTMCPWQEDVDASGVATGETEEPCALS